VTLFETELAVVPPQRREALSEVVVRTPAPPARPGTFVSVVLVADRDSERIERDLAALDAALSEAYPVHEIVLVVPASRGRNVWACALAERQANLQVLGLLHEVTDEVAYTAGLDGALGDVVITARLGVDAPEDIVRCAAMVTDETAVVVGIDSVGKPSRRVAVRLGRALARHSMGEDIVSVSLGLRGYSRSALDAWLPRRDRDRVLRVLPTISGYPSVVMNYTTGVRTRSATRSGVRQVLRSVFYASSRPLRFAVGIALAASMANVLYALYVVGVGLVSGAVEGWTSMSLQMSLMFFLLSIVIAIMAEFMFQSKETANERPIYRVAFEATSSVLEARDRLNVDAEASAVQMLDQDVRRSKLAS
jgi:polyisoprenyl-phosphate glycosyltransferase